MARISKNYYTYIFGLKNRTFYSKMYAEFYAEIEKGNFSRRENPFFQSGKSVFPNRSVWRVINISKRLSRIGSGSISNTQKLGWKCWTNKIPHTYIHTVQTYYICMYVQYYMHTYNIVHTYGHTPRSATFYHTCNTRDLIIFIIRFSGGTRVRQAIRARKID